MNWLDRLDDIANDLLPEEEEEEETKKDKKPKESAGEEKQQREENKNVLDESGLHPVSHEGSIESSKQVEPLEPLKTNATTPATRERDRQRPDDDKHHHHHHHHHHQSPFSSVWLRVDDDDDGSGGILNDPLLPSMNINETATPVRRSSSSSKDGAPQTPHERLQRGLERVMQRVVETAASSTSKLHALGTHNNSKEDGSDQQQLPWVVDSVDDVILMGGSHPLQQQQQQQVELPSENVQQPQQEPALSVSSTTNIFTQQPTGDDTSERPDSKQSSPRRQNYPAMETANRFRAGESHESALPSEIADTELRSMLHTSPSALSEPLPLSVAEQDDDDDDDGNGSVQTDDAGLSVDKRSAKNDPPVIDVSMPPSSVGLVTPSRQAQMRERFRQLQKDSNAMEQQQPQEWNPEKGSFFDPTWNRYGVVQVRVLAAQRLPCPLGSSVQVALSLLPWKGKVRTLSTTSFRGPNDNNDNNNSDNGVCALWNNTTGLDDEETDNDDDEPGCFMVHSYNNEETPIPTIRLDVVFLPLQMLEFVMASVELTAEPLLRHPGQWKRQWCQATLVQDNAKAKEAGSGNHVPAVLLEAAFFPEKDESVDGASTSSEAVDKEDLLDDFDGGNQDVPLQENKVAGSVSALSVRSPVRDPSRSAASPSVKTSRTFLLRAKKRTHFMQVQSLWVPPARCMLCGKSVVGWKLAHRCEHCGVTCCTDCLIQIDLQLPCGTATTKEVVERDEQSRWTLERVLATVAPDESYQKKKTKHEAKKQRVVGVVDEQRPRRIGALETSLQPSHDSSSSGVGKLLVSIDSAYLFADQLPMETELDAVFTESVRHPQRVADHYVRVTAHGSVESKRTHTIQNTATPRFESDVWVFEV